MCEQIFGHHGFFGGYWLIFWILIIVGIVLLVRYIMLQNRPKDEPGETPLEILKKRYAKGEINKKEFEQKKKDLETD